MGIGQARARSRFGDKRLEQRGDRLLERMVEGGSCTLRRISEGRKDVLGFHRFLDNDKVSVEEIVAPAQARLSATACGLHVLAIQDTSEINFQRHAGRVRGLGPVGNGHDRGLFVHPVIAVAAEEGALLGLASAQLWTRAEAGAAAKPDYRKLPVEAKESYRWLVAAEQANATLADAAHVTHIADRESDLYEMWSQVPSQRCDVLLRASRDRAVTGGRLFALAAGWPVAARARIELCAEPGRPARAAVLELRFGEVEIKRPQRCPAQEPETVRLRLVDVRETGGPAGAAIHWRLLTSHQVATAAAAWRIVAWYRQRWHIEQLFRTMKRQGLDLEASQVCGGRALMRLTAMATVAAVQVMQLVLAREGSERPASDVIAPELLTPAAALVARYEGRTAAQKNPHPHGSLAWLSWLIARLGGWTGYRSERPAGPITMRRGWDRFHAIVQGWTLKHDV